MTMAVHNYTIERGVPLPELDYPFENMNVGDSFLVPEAVFTTTVWDEICTQLQTYKQRKNPEYWEEDELLNYRIEKHEVVGGTRIWRVS